MAKITLEVDGTELARAMASAAVAHERLGLALEALERATGIAFREKTSNEFRATEASAQ